VISGIIIGGCLSFPDHCRAALWVSFLSASGVHYLNKACHNAIYALLMTVKSLTLIILAFQHFPYDIQEFDIVNLTELNTEALIVLDRNQVAVGRVIMIGFEGKQDTGADLLLPQLEVTKQPNSLAETAVEWRVTQPKQMPFWLVLDGPRRYCCVAKVGCPFTTVVKGGRSPHLLRNRSVDFAAKQPVSAAITASAG